MIESFPPVYNEQCKVLILGSVPSVKSLAASFYYMHPRNRFWKVMESILKEPVPPSSEEKIALLLKHGVGLWDVIGRCEREGSLDSAIRSPVPNPISSLPNIAKIPIFTNGAAAHAYFKRFFPALIATRLPSTSPANAAHFSIEPWLEIGKYLE